MGYFNIKALSAFKDNYIWLFWCAKTRKAVVVDPGDAFVVEKALEQYKLELEAILITHHHYDHTGGVFALKEKYGAHVTVYAPFSESIKVKDIMVKEQDKVNLSFATFTILAVTGHTKEHIAYYDNAHLFCGDVLFSAGCGRVFEGTLEEMLQSLNKIKELSEETKIYCAHEYTEHNLRFAATIEPYNIDIKNYTAVVLEKLAQGKPSLPSTLLIEKKINPFLRCDVLLKTLTQKGIPFANELAVFTYIRALKDKF